MADKHIVHKYLYDKRPVAFEDYLHYAKIQRELEKQEGRHIVYPDSNTDVNPTPSEKEKAGSEKDGSAEVEPEILPPPPSEDEEIVNARRALRVASYWTVFFLITTDILGPFNAPYAFSQVGFVPGAILYLIFGIAAFYTGCLLWRMFLSLDSDRYPVRCFGDLGDRIFGAWARHLCNVLQSLQLIMNVGLIALSNGQSLSQIITGRNATLCFSVCILIWVFVGWILGQVRSLRSFGIFANSAVWLNLTIIFLSMGIVAHSAPNIAAAQSSFGPAIASGPVATAKFVASPLFTKLNGVNQMIFAYGGAMIFPEFMAEMRRPMDFLKAQAYAQTLIFTVYMTYGCYVYAFQGQYSLPLSFQGISVYSFQTAANVLGMISGIIAGVLYGNIGMKVAYYQIVQGLFNGPPLVSRGGRILWTGMVFIYWSLAFVLVSAIPQVGAISGLVSSLAILQFSYTFPPGMIFGFLVKMDACAGDNEHQIGQIGSGRIDTWRDWSRWKRGLFGGDPRWLLFKWFNFVVFIACLAMAGLCNWGAILTIEQALANGAATSFGCTPPV